ncbi:hypothetical protein BDN72DRAFT_834350 [Pluteus cervinus]|uniref:Uncharacterized protein n=1 Tax=Pluteus cervinus TaxID=181527 RepID=A0ACD3B830_9AGAR|nr:hypothetical protein BDN72DRAFT_834350 [Pluteus cervinus]
MAQALFDEHPLEQYLRDAGEATDIMPGTSSEIILDLDPHAAPEHQPTQEEVDAFEWRPVPLRRLMMALQSAIRAHRSSIPRSFVERFKYDVISSSLLAPSLAAPQSRRSSSTVDLPGKLKFEHHRTPSNDSRTPSPTSHVDREARFWIPSLALLTIVSFIGSGQYIYAILSVCGSLALMHKLKLFDSAAGTDMTPCLESLNQLISSSDVWESAVSSAIKLLEIDEQRSMTFGGLNPASPSTSLRVALHSTLTNVQSQCDNVRLLFSALASPNELTQISEMYAPPSPMKLTHTLPESSSPRPLSLQDKRKSRSITSPKPLAKDSKRSTWNGGSPFSRTYPRERHQSDVTLRPILLSSTPSPSLTSTSAPTTPLLSEHFRALPEVQEETTEQEASVPIYDSDSFAPAALSFRRNRRSVGQDAFRSFITPTRSPRTPQTPLSAQSSSRLTTIKTHRRLHSFSAVDHALQGALASRRYACSHLLALRFFDEEDPGYWEDVRSMMDLLATTFSEAAVHISEGLEDLERKRLIEENPTPRCTPPKLGEIDELEKPPKRRSRLSGGGSSSFAPMMSHISRFALHIEAISASLEDARANLDECVAALKEEQEPDESSSDLQGQDQGLHERQSSTASSSSIEFPRSDRSTSLIEESKAIQAYDRLRRELGMALRECERGKERLLDIVYPSSVPLEDEDGLSDGVPGFGHDNATDESPSSPREEDSPHRHRHQDRINLAVVAPDGTEARLDDVAADSGVGLGGGVDDVTTHLLLSASVQHLPPQGIEHVYEADSGAVGMFERERSKLTREERIKLAKARRESGGGLLASIEPPKDEEAGGGLEREKWGPSGDVVQELKDVIWKVGEKKRRMNEAKGDSTVQQQLLEQHEVHIQVVPVASSQ